MNDVMETTILEEYDIKITNLRARVGTETYNLANITSARIIKERSVLNLFILALIGLSLLIGLFSLGSSIYSRSLGITAFTILGGALVIALTAQPTYHLMITSGLGTTDILQSMDEDYVKRIHEAIRYAITHHG
jgi:hypothetical protein